MGRLSLARDIEMARMALREGIFQREGWGVYFEATCGRNFVHPPLFRTLPTPTGVFSGVGESIDFLARQIRCDRAL